MALQAGDIVFDIKADDTQLKQSLESVKNSFANTSKAVGAAMSVVGGVITGFAASAVNDFVETGSAINDMALRTGFGTTALQELGYAAGLSGGSMDDVEKAAKKMSTVIFGAGEEAKAAGAKQAEAFSKGSKEIVSASGANTDALTALGLNYQSLKAMKPEDQFKAIGFALADVKDATARAALAQQMFGRAGTALLPFLSEGRAGFEAMAAEAHRLNIIIGPEGIKAADDLGDEWDKLKAGLRGLGFDIAEVLVPSLIGLATDVRQIMETFSGWRQSNPALFDSIAQITVVVGGLMLALGPLLMVLPGITTAIGLFGGASTVAAGAAGVGGMAGLSAGVIGFMAAFGPAIIAIGLGVWSFAALSTAMAETQAAQEQLAQSNIRLAEKEEERNQKLREKSVILDAAIMQEMTYEERLSYRAQQETMQADITLRAWISHFAGRAATEEEFARARNAALNENVTAQEAAMIAIKDTHGEVTKTIMRADADQTETLIKSFGIRKDIQIKGASELTEAEIAAARTTQNAWIESNGAVAQSTVAKAEEVKTVWGRVIDFMAGNLLWVIDLVQRAGQYIGFLGPSSGGAPGLATGGTIDRGGWAMVGERGPELVRLPGGATVYDSGQTQQALQAGGGATINMSFNLYGGDARENSRTIADTLVMELRARGI